MRQKIAIFKKEIVSACIVEVAAGTNCPQGGDTGHGGRTFFQMADKASTDMRMAIDGGPYVDISSFTLVFGGDLECEVFIEAMEFAIDTYRGKHQTEVVEIP